jgi:hypothetical protein
MYVTKLEAEQESKNHNLPSPARSRQHQHGLLRRRLRRRCCARRQDFGEAHDAVLPYTVAHERITRDGTLTEEQKDVREQGGVRVPCIARSLRPPWLRRSHLELQADNLKKHMDAAKIHMAWLASVKAKGGLEYISIEQELEKMEEKALAVDVGADDRKGAPDVRCGARP